MTLPPTDLPTEGKKSIPSNTNQESEPLAPTMMDLTDPAIRRLAIENLSHVRRTQATNSQPKPKSNIQNPNKKA